MQLLLQSIYIKWYKISFIVCGLCLVMLGCGKKQVELEIKNANTIPVIDGIADKVWEETEWTDIGSPPADSAKKANLSGKFKVLHDKANFYLLVEVTDDAKFRRPVPKSALEAKFDFFGRGINDCVTISFVVGDTKGKEMDETNIMYVYDYDSVMVNNKTKMLSDFKLRQTKTSGGYLMESSIPFEKIKYEAGKNLPIVAKMSIMDNDSTSVSPDVVTLPTKTISWGTPLIWGTKDFGKFIVKD